MYVVNYVEGISSGNKVLACARTCFCIVTCEILEFEISYVCFYYLVIQVESKPANINID